MDSLGRLLLRVVLVPLGYFVAVIIGTLVIVFGSWKLGVAASDPDQQPFAIFGFVFAAPVLLVMLLSMMWLPCRYRRYSFPKHLRSGPGSSTPAMAQLSAWIGWSLFGYIDDSRIPLNEPLPVVAAGACRRFGLLGDRGLERGLLETRLSSRPGGAAAESGLTSAGNPLGNLRYDDLDQWFY